MFNIEVIVYVYKIVKCSKELEVIVIYYRVLELICGCWCYGICNKEY